MFKWVLKTYQMEVAKVIWSREHRRDCTRDKVSRQHDSKAWWRRTTATLLGVSFGNYRRRRRDVLMGNGRYVPLRLHWVFHLRRRGDVLMGRRHYVPWDVIGTYQKDIMKMYHWDVLAMFHWDVVGCFIWDVPTTSLGRTERRCYNVATTSCCRVCIFK